MGQCCTIQLSPRPQRRINGLQLPLHFQQVVGWIVFFITALLNFTMLVQIQFDELKVVSICVYCILYVLHVSSHLTAMLIDASETDLRKMQVNTLPEFDRNVHAHVIENGRCHLCNIDTSSRKTKHCSTCNKCIDSFDHHCKWLNNCIGRRNYAPFIICVISAVLISLYTSSLCLTDIVFFLAYPHKLSAAAQNFVNCTSAAELTYPKFCRNSVSFLTFLIIFCVSALSIGIALLHLCCFHVYISILGVSTYEYVVRGSPPGSLCNENRAWCTIGASRYKNKSIQSEAQQCERNFNGSENGSSETWLNANISNTINNEQRVSSFIGILINNEIDRARKMFLYDKNKVHPNNESTG